MENIFTCSNNFYNSEVTAAGIQLFKFPSLPSDINRWCNQVKRQNDKDGFNVFSNAEVFRITINSEEQTLLDVSNDSILWMHKIIYCHGERIKFEFYKRM